MVSLASACAAACLGVLLVLCVCVFMQIVEASDSYPACLPPHIDLIYQSIGTLVVYRYIYIYRCKVMRILNDQMNRTIGPIYHILLKSEYGRWTRSPFKDHPVLQDFYHQQHHPCDKSQIPLKRPITTHRQPSLGLVWMSFR